MGPLPALYRVLIAGLVLLLSVATGIWLAQTHDLPLGGVGVGIGSGSLLAFGFLHDFRRTRHRV
jgi:hypothetical protein